MVREMLEEDGIHDLLPSNEQCVAITHALRAAMFSDLPKNRELTLRLQDVYPMMEPKSPLTGLNHTAALLSRLFLTFETGWSC